MNFKSYGFWTALAGALTILVNALGRCFGFSVEDEVITNVVMAIAGVLVVLGVVSIPKNSSKEENKEEINTEETKDNDTQTNETDAEKEEQDK